MKIFALNETDNTQRIETLFVDNPITRIKTTEDEKSSSQIEEQLPGMRLIINPRKKRNASEKKYVRSLVILF